MCACDAGTCSRSYATGTGARASTPRRHTLHERLDHLWDLIQRERQRAVARLNFVHRHCSVRRVVIGHGSGEVDDGALLELVQHLAAASQEKDVVRDAGKWDLQELVLGLDLLDRLKRLQQFFFVRVVDCTGGPGREEHAGVKMRAQVHPARLPGCLPCCAPHVDKGTRVPHGSRRRAGQRASAAAAACC